MKNFIQYFLTLLLLTLSSDAFAQASSGSIPQGQMLGSKQTVVLTNFAGNKTGKYIVSLSFFTNCYNTTAKMKARIDLDAQHIEVLQYSHFASKNTNDPTNSAGSKVYPKSEAYAHFKLSIQGNQLRLEQLKNACGGNGKLRINASSWKKHTKPKPLTTSGNIPQGQLFSNKQATTLTNFGGNTTGQYLADLNFFTNCYNLTAKMKAVVDLGKRHIEVLEYSHFASKSTNDPINAAGFQVYPKSKAYSYFKLSIQGNELRLEQLENPCGTKLRINASSWKKYTPNAKPNPAPKPVLRPFNPNRNTLYVFQSKGAGHQNVDVYGAKTAPGTNISLYGNSPKGEFNQRFHFVDAGSGYYYIESSLKERMVIDIADAKTSDGVNAQLVRRGNGTNAQKFKLMDAGSGYVQIVSAMGQNLYLGVSDDNKNVVLRNGDKGDKVLFKLIKVKSMEKLFSLNVLNYNAMLLPKILFPNHKQEDRAIQIPSAIQKAGEFDVVVFNEAFSNDARSKLYFVMFQFGYVHTTKVVDKSGNLENGGVFIMSRHPIEYSKMLVFKDCSGDDCSANKGVMYAKIKKEGKSVHVFGTHLQADRGTKEAQVRRGQLRQISEFAAPLIKNAKRLNEPVIFAGDFNFCFRQDKEEYQNTLRTLNATTTALPKTDIDWTFDPKKNSVARYRYEGEPSQWLDYIFVGNTSIQPTSSTHRVHKFRTTKKYNMPAHGDPLGVFDKGTFHYDLSDHYGLSASYKFDIQ